MMMMNKDMTCPDNQTARWETMPVWFEHTISMMNGTQTFFFLSKSRNRNLQPSKKNLLDRIHFSHGSGVNTCQEKDLNTTLEMFVWQLIETISVILSHPWQPSLRASRAGSSFGRPAGVSDWSRWRFEQRTGLDVDVCVFSFFFWAKINQHVINITYFTQLSSWIMIDVSGYRILIQSLMYAAAAWIASAKHPKHLELQHVFLSGVVKCPDMIHDDIHVYVNIKCFFPGIEICGRPSIWWFQLSWKIILYLSWIISQNFGAKTKQSLKPPVSYFKNHVKYSAYFGELFSLPNSCFCFLAPNSSLVPPPPATCSPTGCCGGTLFCRLAPGNF